MILSVDYHVIMKVAYNF